MTNASDALREVARLNQQMVTWTKSRETGQVELRSRDPDRGSYEFQWMYDALAGNWNFGGFPKFTLVNDKDNSWIAASRGKFVKIGCIDPLVN